MKRWLVIIPVLLIIAIVTYVVMIYDTNSVVEDFEHCINGENISQDLINTELYNKYFSHINAEVTDAHIDVKRVFVFHNFKEGVMRVKYSYEIFDDNNNCLRGAKDVYSKWHIQKENGKWRVIKIEEKP